MYFDSEDIEINGTLQHTNESSAEGYNVTAFFYFPPFIVFKELTYINFTQPQISEVSNGHGVQMEVGRGCW